MPSSGNIPVLPQNSNIELYDHQKDAYAKLSKWSTHTDGKPAGLLVLPTGGGKTLTATYWLMQNVLSKGKKVLWIAHRYSLLEQAYYSFKMVSYQNISSGNKSNYSYRIISGVHESAYSINPNEDILIASKASLSVNKDAFRNWLEKNRDNFYFVIDEAHHAPARGYRNLVSDMRQYGGRFFMLGLTATPFRTDEEEKGWMKAVFTDDILYRISLSTLISREILSQPDFERIPTNIDMRKLFRDNGADDVYNRIIHNRNFEFDAGKYGKLAADIVAQNHNRNKLIVETYKKSAAKYGKTLVFAVNQAMARLLYQYFQAAGVRVGCVISDYGSYANEITIQNFKDDKLDVLVNVNIVTEGVDVPNVQTVFLTRPTKSKILMTQMIGRGLRGTKVGGTAITYIVDFLDKWHDDLVAWVIPEKLHKEEEIVDKIIVGGESPPEQELSDLEILRTISEGKLAEFIKLANSTFDLSLFEKFSLMERIPLGYYSFDYESIEEDGDGGTKSCTVLVYDCMKPLFDELMNWLANRTEKKFFDIEATADEIDEKFFGAREQLLGYSKDNICDILYFYVQNAGELPPFVKFEKRNEYDISALAQYILDKKLSRIEESKYKESVWNQADGKWKNFFGENNRTAFLTSIEAEIARKLGELNTPTNTLTDEEKNLAENVPLDVLVVQHNDIYEKMRDAVYEKFHDSNGYFDSKGNRSKSRMDFYIDYKTPLSAGGKTEIDNLQLVYSVSSKNLVWENMSLSDIEQQDPALYKKICDDVYRYYQLHNGNYYDEKNHKRSYSKSDFKIEYKTPLNQGGKTTIENLYLAYQKAVTPQSSPVTTPAPQNINSSNVTNGGNISGTNLTWTLDAAGTLTISGNGDMKNWDYDKNLVPWYGQLEAIEKIVIKDGVTSIGDFAFWCSNLNEIKISDYVTEIGKQAFYNCGRLTEIIIPEGVTEIKWLTFAKCDNLKKVTIPSAVQTIGDHSFAFCRNFESIEILGNLDKIETGAFRNCKNLKEIKIHGTLTTIGGYNGIGAFSGCDSLMNIDQILNKGVQIIENYAFRYCQNLQSVTIPRSVQQIGKKVFDGCINLQVIKYPRGLYSAEKLGEGNNAKLIPY